MKHAVAVIGLALAYGLTAYLSNQFSAPPSYASSLWLPAGVGLFGALRFGSAGLLGVFLGALAVNVLKLFDAGSAAAINALPEAVLISLGSTVGALIAAWLCRWLGIWPDPPAGWRLISRVTLITALSCGISAAIGTTVLWAQGSLVLAQWGSTLTTWWLGDVAGMLLLFPVVYWPDAEHAAQRRGFASNLLLPSLLAFVLAVFAFIQLLNADRERQQVALAAEAHHLQGELANGAARAVSLMRALGAYVEGGEEINAAQFASFAGGLRALGSSVQALQWAPRLERQDAVAAYQRRLLRNNDPVPTLHPVPGIPNWPSEPVMVPITYMVPMEGNLPAFGLDLYSEPLRRATLQAAWDRNDVVATPPLQLVQRPGLGHAYLLDKPVWRNAPDEPMHGYVQGVFTLEQIAESAIAQSEGRGLAWTIQDLGWSDQVLLSHGGPPLLGDQDLQVESLDVPVAGRTWRLTVASTPDFLYRTQSLNLWAAQLGCILVASAWGLFLFAQWVQTRSLTSLSDELQLRNSELRRSQRLFESLAEAAPTAIFRTGRKGAVSYANPAYRQIMDLEHSESSPRRAKDALHPEDRAEFHRRRTLALRQGLPFDMIFRLITAARGERWVLAHANPVNDAQGQFDGHIGSMTDITVLKRNEKALQRLNDAPTADREAFLHHVTAAMAQIFGSEIAFIAEYTDPSQGRSRRLSFYCDGQFLTPTEQSLEQSPCAAVARDDVVVVHEHVQQAYPLDHELAVLGAEAYAAAALRRLDGTPRGYVGIIRRGRLEGVDAAAILNLFRLRISAELERWDHRDQQQALLESLEVRVAERTAALRQTAEQADRANRAKSDFLATMSHEIRTPMNSALGLLELVLRQPLGRDQQQMLESVQDATRSLLRLIDDLLDLSQIEAGAMRLEPEPVALPDLLARLDDLYRFGAEAKQLDFKITAEAGLADAYWVDRLRLRQILANLLANAIKFTDAGGVSLHLRLSDRQNGRDQLEFVVTDTGIGVDAKQLQRLFQPFTRASEAVGQQRGGSGLGLSISRRLAEKLGGSLDMVSEPGKGSQLTLRLPLLPARSTNEASESDGGAADSLPPDAIPGLVLAVEDHGPSRLLIERQLRELGYPHRLAADGEAGWALWQELHPSIVVTDCNMPNLDGYGLAKRIRDAERADGGAHRTRIIACTADLVGSSEQLSRSTPGQIDLLLTKPLSLAALREALRLDSAAAAPPVASEDSRKQKAIRYLAELCGGDRAAAEVIAQEFLASIADDLGALSTALAAADGPRSRELLHRLKGALSSLGDTELSDFVARLHRLAVQSQPDLVQAQLGELVRQLKQLDPTLSTS